MPITQPRMQSLIAAALDYQQAFRRLCQIVQAAQRRALERGAIAPDELDNLSAIAVETILLTNPIESSNTILLEQNHFRIFSRRNAKSRERQALKRLISNRQPGFSNDDPPLFDDSSSNGAPGGRG